MCKVPTYKYNLMVFNQRAGHNYGAIIFSVTSRKVRDSKFKQPFISYNELSTKYVIMNNHTYNIGENTTNHE